RMLTYTAPNTATTTWTWVAAGPQTITEQVTASQSRTTTYSYYANGKLQTITAPLSRVTQLSYVGNGDLDYIDDASGHRTSFDYDPMGRLEKTILPATTPANDSPATSYDTLG